MKIVVIGGTGLIGSKTVAILRQGGHEVVAASPKRHQQHHRRGPQGGHGRRKVVIDLANSPSFEDKAVLEFFETSGRNLSRRRPRGRPAPCRALHRRNRPDARQWLFPRQGRPRETDRDLRHPLHHHPLDPVPGIPRRHRRFKCGWKQVRLSPGLFQPIAADDVAAIVADVALAAPRSGIVEIAGPERAPFNEIVARYLKAVGDPRQVVVTPRPDTSAAGSRSTRSCRWAKRARPNRLRRMAPPLKGEKPDPNPPTEGRGS